MYRVGVRFFLSQEDEVFAWGSNRPRVICDNNPLITEERNVIYYRHHGMQLKELHKYVCEDINVYNGLLKNENEDVPLEVVLQGDSNDY